MVDTSILESTRLSQRLKNETAERHEQLQQLMDRAQPFANRANYTRFAVAQYLFQRDVEHLFVDPGMQAMVPDLALRGRATAALADLADLGSPTPPEEPVASTGVGMPATLGWLYVSEGSTLGAAFLFKEAQARLGLSAEFGARNLAAYPEGRATAWRNFVTALDAKTLDVSAHADVIAGANSAYDRFAVLLGRLFSLHKH